MIEGYDSFEPVGHGGFSTVYRAYQELLDRVVAVKVLHADLGDPDARRRFVRECRATGRLTGHPNVVTVFDAGTTRDHRPYLAMEYFPGGSLADVLASSGPLAVPAAVRIAAAVADALDAAHRNGILHRDIKPANILLRRADAENPVLSDFGIASIEAGLEAATASAAFTPAYAAPEVLLGDRPTVASDVFAFGATLFALLAGGPPFGGRVPVEILARARDGAVEPLGREDVPDGVRDLLLRMLDAEPSRRPGSAAEVAAELAAIPGSRPAGLGPAGPSPAVPARPTPGTVVDAAAPRRRAGRAGARRPASAAVVTAAVVVAVAAVVILSFLLLRPPAGGSGEAASPDLASPDAAAEGGGTATAAGEPPGGSCPRRREDTTDYRNRVFADRYYCMIYTGSAVYSNVGAGQAAEPLDDSGFMYEARSSWVICQIRGRANPVVRGNTNTWWLYTKADGARSNAHGYENAWGYLPATAVSQGGQNEPVPGVPVCTSAL
jgi:hypothetical protein